MNLTLRGSLCFTALPSDVHNNNEGCVSLLFFSFHQVAPNKKSEEADEIFEVIE